MESHRAAASADAATRARLARLYRELLAWAKTHLLHRPLRHHDFEDFVQGAILRALHRPAGLRGRSEREVFAWLTKELKFRSADVALSDYRRRKREREVAIRK